MTKKVDDVDVPGSSENALWEAAKEKVRALATVESRDRAHVEKQVAEKDFWPGKINYVDNRGHHPGATCVCITSPSSENVLFPGSPEGLAKAIDKYFQDNPGRLVLDIKPNADLTAALVLYTRVVDKDELDDFNEVQQIANTLINDLREFRAKQKEEQEKEKNKEAVEAKQKADDAMKELVKYAELGRTHERNCKKKK